MARAADRWEESDFARTERGLIFVVDGGGIADVPFARARDGGRREAMAGDESERGGQDEERPTIQHARVAYIT